MRVQNNPKPLINNQINLRQSIPRNVGIKLSSGDDKALWTGINWNCSIGDETQ